MDQPEEDPEKIRREVAYVAVPMYVSNEHFNDSMKRTDPAVAESLRGYPLPLVLSMVKNEYGSFKPVGLAHNLSIDPRDVWTKRA